jgi:hypothetical protein
MPALGTAIGRAVMVTGNGADSLPSILERLALPMTWLAAVASPPPPPADPETKIGTPGGFKKYVVGTVYAVMVMADDITDMGWPATSALMVTTMDV